MRSVGLVVAAWLVAAGVPAGAEPGLYERNFAFLLGLFPDGGVIEVQLVEDGEPTTQLWSVEQYAAFRATYAAAMGRDYLAGWEGVPVGVGDHQYLGDVWADLWGTTRANVVVPRGLPRTIITESKIWFYGGSGARTVVMENENECVQFPGYVVCSATYGWFYPQAGDAHGDAWFSGTGFFWVFPPPFGSFNFFNGALFADGL